MATNTGDLYVNVRADIKGLKKGLKQATNEIKKFGGKMDKSTKSNENFFKSFAKGRNDLVRTIRQLETLFVATLAIRASYKVLIGQGLELNKQYQDQALGIAALISAKTNMVDETGRELSSYEQFIATQEVTKGVMDDIKEAALDTPASFQQMVGFYQQSIGHALSANGTFGDSLEMVNKNVITMTQGMSALGSSMGMEMMKVNEEIRSIMSGNASTDSLLAMVLFGSPTQANEAVRNAKKTTNGLSTLVLDALAPFKNVQEVTTYSKAVARLSASFEEMQKGITADLFEDLTYAFVDLKKEMDEGMDGFIQTWVDVYNEAKAFFDTTLGALGDMGAMVSDLIGDIFDMTGELEAFKIVAIAIATIFRAIEKAVLGVRIALNKAKEIAYEVQKATGLGDFNPANARTKEQTESIEYAKQHRSDAAYKATIKRIDEQNKGTIDAQLKANQEYYDAVVAQGKKLQDDFDNQKVLDFSADAKNYDQVRDAASYRKGIEDSYKGTENIQEAYESIAAATQAATDAAGDNEKILVRIGIQTKSAVKSAKAYFLAQKATRSMNGKINKEDEKGKKKAAKAANDASRARAKLIKDEERAIKDYKDLVADIADDLAGSFAGLFGPIGDSLYQFYKDAMDIMKAFEAAEAARVAANTARAQAQAAGEAPAAITKAGSQAGMYGAIAMAGLLAALGIATSGVLNPSESAPELGEFANTSDSTVNALDRIYDVQYPLLELTRDMTRYLEIIANSFGGITNTLLNSQANLGGQGFQDISSSGFLFGGSNTSLYGTELDFGAATLGELMGGDLSALYNATLEYASTTWYGASRTSYDTFSSDISSSFAGFIADATTAAFEGLVDAGEALNIDTSSLSGMNIDLGAIDVTGMSPEEISEEIEARFSAQMDAITYSVFGQVSEFQRAGESMYETLNRVIVNFDQVSYSLEKLDKSVDWRTANIIVETAGGLDELGSAMEAYTSSFFTAQEQYDMASTEMKDNFTALGLTMPQTNDEFRALIDTFDTTKDTEAELFAETLLLAEGFAELTEMAKELEAALTTLTDGDLFINLTEMVRNLTSREIALTGDDKAIAEYELEISRIMVELIKAQTELHDVTMDNYFDELEAAHLANELTSEQLENWTSLGDAFLNVEEAQKAYNDLLKSQAETELAFHESVLSQIESFYSGTLSYLNSIELAEYLGRLADIKLDTGDQQGYIDTLTKQLTAVKATSTTKEEYISAAERYVYELSQQEPEEDPVVKTLEDILAQNARIEEAVTNASYQSAINPLEVIVVG